MPISKVFMICVAYEQGVGKGQANSMDRNPYRDGSEEHEAWGYGYEEGERMNKRQGREGE